MQALLRADAGQEADAERSGAPLGLRGRAVPLQPQAEGHHVEAVPRHVQVPGHEVGVHGARRQEPVHVAGAPAQLLAGLGAEGLHEAVEEDLLPLDGAQHRPAEGPLQRPRQTGEHGVGELHEIRTQVPRQPPAQLLQLAALAPLLAPQHREGEGPQVPGLGRSREAAGGPAQQARPVEGARRPGGRRRTRADFCAR